VPRPESTQDPHLRVKSLEARRGVAATLVLLSHCGHTLGAPQNFGAPPFGLLFQFGRAGADIFFVLSGFLIALVHWRDVDRPERLRHYLARRITRIYPTYWMMLLAIVPIDLVTRTFYDRYGEPWEVVKNILLLPQNDQIIDVAWSLCNELLFYAVFGLIIFSRKVGLLALAAWIGAMVARPFAAPGDDIVWLNLLTYPMNFEFLAGLAAGWALQRRPFRRPTAMLIAGLALFAVFAVVEDRRLLWSNEFHAWFPGEYWPIVILRSLGYGTAGVLIIAGLSSLEIQGRIRVPRALRLLGGGSYLLYLSHVPALVALGASERRLHLLRSLPPWLLAVLFVLLIVSGVMGLHLAIEKPLLRAVRPAKSAGPIQPSSALV
jgi:peptidoglycan/LPS O-acetylase OafA/YrhL